MPKPAQDGVVEVMAGLDCGGWKYAAVFLVTLPDCKEKCRELGVHPRQCLAGKESPVQAMGLEMNA